ncbi:hydroxymethylbilane synthase [bacterium]|nr:hydroxymethylbilane synthase [bacterium]
MTQANPSSALTLRIGTRKSPLALWQANWVRDRLLKAHPGLAVELVRMSTEGDRVLNLPLAQLGGKDIFTKEIENALLEDRVDLAVHSLKDLPTQLPEGLFLAAVCKREDPRDALVAREAKSLGDLPEGAIVATGSLRRKAQLLGLRPDVRIVDVRGNVGTRLRKYAEAGWDGMILAKAGLVRMGLEEHIACVLSPEEMLSGVGQGALAIEIREGDARTGELIRGLQDPDTTAETAAERAFLARLEGGCQVPIAALGIAKGDGLRLDGLVASLNGTICFRDQTEGAKAEGKSLGRNLAERLLERGAREILESIRNG